MVNWRDPGIKGGVKKLTKSARFLMADLEGLWYKYTGEHRICVISHDFS